MAVTACNGRDTAERETLAAQTVRAFFSALADGDEATIAELAPDLVAENDGWLQGIREFGGDITTTIDDVTLDGDSALATVSLSTTADGDGVTRIVVPLRWSGERWDFTDSLTIRQEIDIVPITPEP